MRPYFQNERPNKGQDTIFLTCIICTESFEKKILVLYSLPNNKTLEEAQLKPFIDDKIFEVQMN